MVLGSLNTEKNRNISEVFYVHVKPHLNLQKVKLIVLSLRKSDLVN